MGTWSTAINGNDEFMSVYETFRELYFEHNGKDWVHSLPGIKKKMNEQFSFQLSDKDLADEFWFAQAKAFWDFGISDDPAFKQVKKIIESGSNIEVWRRLNADEKTLTRRKKVLDDFLNKIAKKNPKPVARKKVQKIDPPFGDGDLVTFSDDKGNYYGAVITGAYRDEKGRCVVHLLNYRSKKKPGSADLVNAALMVHRKTSKEFSSNAWGNRRKTNIYGFILTAKGFGQSKTVFEKTGNVEFDKYGYFKDGLSSFCDMTEYAWDVLTSLAALNYNHKPKGNQSVLSFYTTETSLNDKEIKSIIDSLRKEKSFKILSAAFDPKKMAIWPVYMGSWNKVGVYIAIKGYDKLNSFFVNNAMNRLFGQWLESLGLAIDPSFRVEDYGDVSKDLWKEDYISTGAAIRAIEKMKK